MISSVMILCQRLILNKFFKLTLQSVLNCVCKALQDSRRIKAKTEFVLQMRSLAGTLAVRICYNGYFSMTRLILPDKYLGELIDDGHVLASFVQLRYYLGERAIPRAGTQQQVRRHYMYARINITYWGLSEGA